MVPRMKISWIASQLQKPQNYIHQNFRLYGGNEFDLEIYGSHATKQIQV